MISNEVDDDEDEDAATHVLPSKDVLGDTDLAELAERARRNSRPRTAPPPIPSRVPPPAPPRPHAVAPDPAWAEEEDYNETLTYGEGADDDQLPTAIPPQAQPTMPDAPSAGHFYPGSLGSVAPRRAIPDQLAPIPFDRTAVSPPDMRPLTPAGTDTATKLLLALIVLLAVALAVVLVLIVRR